MACCKAEITALQDGLKRISGLGLIWVRQAAQRHAATPGAVRCIRQTAVDRLPDRVGKRLLNGA